MLYNYFITWSRLLAIVYFGYAILFLPSSIYLMTNQLISSEFRRPLESIMSDAIILLLPSLICLALAYIFAFNPHLVARIIRLRKSNDVKNADSGADLLNVGIILIGLYCFLSLFTFPADSGNLLANLYFWKFNLRTLLNLFQLAISFFLIYGREKIVTLLYIK